MSLKKRIKTTLSSKLFRFKSWPLQVTSWLTTSISNGRQKKIHIYHRLCNLESNFWVVGQTATMKNVKSSCCLVLSVRSSGFKRRKEPSASQPKLALILIKLLFIKTLQANSLLKGKSLSTACLKKNTRVAKVSSKKFMVSLFTSIICQNVCDLNNQRLRRFNSILLKTF